MRRVGVGVSTVCYLIMRNIKITPEKMTVCDTVVRTIHGRNLLGKKTVRPSADKGNVEEKFIERFPKTYLPVDTGQHRLCCGMILYEPRVLVNTVVVVVGIKIETVVSEPAKITFRPAVVGHKTTIVLS